MSDVPDPLEEELLSLRPHEPSPELRRGVAERLADASPVKLRRLWWLAVSGGLAAACLAAVLLWWGRGREEDHAPGPRPVPLAVIDDAPPTLLAYQRALAGSLEELDALLDRQAVTDVETNPDLVPAAVFSRSDAALHDLLGEN
jgi:hypothetical protein